MNKLLFKSIQPVEYYTRGSWNIGNIEGEFIRSVSPGRMLMKGLMFDFEIACETFAMHNKIKSNLVKQVTADDVLTLGPGQYQYNVFGQLKEITEIFHVGRSNSTDKYFACMYQKFNEDGSSTMSHTIREGDYILWNPIEENIKTAKVEQTQRLAYISEIGNMAFLNFYNSTRVYSIKGFDTVRKARNYANKYGYTLTETKPSYIADYENVD